MNTTISPQGGTISAAGMVTAFFPPGAFASSVTASVYARSLTTDLQNDYEVGAVTFPLAPTATRVVVLTTGMQQPLADITTIFDVPAEVVAALRSGLTISVMSKMWQQGQDTLDYFVALPSSYDSAAGTVSAAVPPYAFTDERRSDRLFEAIFLIAVAPGSPVLPLSSRALSIPGTSACALELITPPVDGPLTVTSPFGVRLSSTKGIHWGVDLRASTVTPVRAVADGVVERIGYQSAPGAGYYMVLRHSGSSLAFSVSKYMHLAIESAVYQPGTPVRRGDIIALSDTTGTSEPHLHLEYLSAFGSHVDPMPCVIDLSGTWSGSFSGSGVFNGTPVSGSGNLTAVLVQSGATIAGTYTTSTGGAGTLSCAGDLSVPSVTCASEGTIAGCGTTGTEDVDYLSMQPPPTMNISYVRQLTGACNGSEQGTAFLTRQ